MTNTETKNGDRAADDARTTTEAAARAAIRRVADYAGVGTDKVEVAYRSEYGAPGEFYWEVRCQIWMPPTGRERKGTQHTARGDAATIEGAVDACIDSLNDWAAFQQQQEKATVV